MGFVASTRASAVIAAALPIFITFDVISEFMCWTKLSMPYVCISINKLINQSIGAHVINILTHDLGEMNITYMSMASDDIIQHMPVLGTRMHPLTLLFIGLLK